jgi:hypothetical protein
MSSTHTSKPPANAVWSNYASEVHGLYASDHRIASAMGLIEDATFVKRDLHMVPATRSRKTEVAICQARVSHHTRKDNKDSTVVHCVPKLSARAELQVGLQRNWKAMQQNTAQVYHM